MEKNRDTISEDLIQLLSRTKNSFLKSLLPDNSDASKTRKLSLGSQFSSQLDALSRLNFNHSLKFAVTTLNATEPHYIRCIKPNTLKRPLEFHAQMVLEQLTNSGVFEAVQIRKSGFPFRYSHEMFCKRYKCIKPTMKYKSFKEGCELLLQEMKMDPAIVQIGRSRVLYRADQHKVMELKRNVALEDVTIFLQKQIRGWSVRKMTKFWKSKRQNLKSKIQKRELADLETALSELMKVRFPFLELTKAKDLRDVLYKERDCDLMLEKIFPKDPEECFEEFSKAVALANELDLHSAISEQVRSKLKIVAERRQCIKDLKQGLEEVSQELLEKGLAVVKQVALKDSALIKQSEEMVKRIKEEDKYIAQLKEATDKGGWLKEGDTISSDGLFVAVKKASDFKMMTAEGKKILRLAEILLPLRQFLSMAVGTKERALWAPIEALVICTEPGFEKHPEIIAAKAGLATLAAKEEIEERLAKGVEDRNPDELDYGIHAATQIGMDENDYPIVGEAKQWLASINECRGYIKQGVEEVDEETLVYACDYADSLQYNGNDVKECRALRDKVVVLNQDSEDAVKVLVHDQMRAIVEAAAAIGLNTPVITRLYDLLYNTTEEKFMELQLEAAQSTNDPKRITKVTIKLKDLFFDKVGEQYHIARYPRMLQPTEFAQAKYFGLAFNKEKIAAGFYMHSLQPIHVALIRDLPPLESKEARRIFKTIMCYMGDRQNTSDSILLALDVLAKGIQMEALRPEIFVQIIKQVTNNPSSVSTAKGWELMAICLDCFPPGKESENYVEYFIRKGGCPNVPFFLQLLHQSYFAGPVARVPFPDEIKKTISGSSFRDFGEEKKYEIADYSKAPTRPVVSKKKQGQAGFKSKFRPIGKPGEPVQIDDQLNMTHSDTVVQDPEDEDDFVEDCDDPNVWEECVDPDTGDIVSRHFFIFLKSTSITTTKSQESRLGNFHKPLSRAKTTLESH